MEKMKRAYACFFISAALLLLCVAVCPTKGQENIDEIKIYRMERDEIRSICLKELNQLIGDQLADTQLRRQARKEKLHMLSAMEQESSLEALLCHMGYADCAVSVRADSVYVAIRDFQEKDSAMVLELILRETGQSPSSVRILPV